MVRIDAWEGLLYFTHPHRMQVKMKLALAFPLLTFRTVPLTRPCHSNGCRSTCMSESKLRCFTCEWAVLSPMLACCTANASLFSRFALVNRFVLSRRLRPRGATWKSDTQQESASIFDDAPNITAAVTATHARNTAQTGFDERKQQQCR